MALTQEARDRLAELREQDVERSALAKESAEERELEARELGATLEARGLKRDLDFKVIDHAMCGVYAIRKPDGRAIRNWDNASDKEKLTLEWLIGIMRHYIIEPDEKAPAKALQWAQMCGQRPGLCWTTSTAFIQLMGVDTEAHQKK